MRKRDCVIAPSTPKVMKAKKKKTKGTGQRKSTFWEKGTRVGKRQYSGRHISLVWGEITPRVGGTFVMKQIDKHTFKVIELLQHRRSS